MIPFIWREKREKGRRGDQTEPNRAKTILSHLYLSVVEGISDIVTTTEKYLIVTTSYKPQNPHRALGFIGNWKNSLKNNKSQYELYTVSATWSVGRGRRFPLKMLMMIPALSSSHAALRARIRNNTAIPAETEKWTERERGKWRDVHNRHCTAARSPLLTKREKRESIKTDDTRAQNDGGGSLVLVDHTKNETHSADENAAGTAIHPRKQAVSSDSEHQHHMFLQLVSLP